MSIGTDLRLPKQKHKVPVLGDLVFLLGRKNTIHLPLRLTRPQAVVRKGWTYWQLFIIILITYFPEISRFLSIYGVFAAGRGEGTYEVFVFVHLT